MKRGLTTWILVGVVAGVVVGLLFHAWAPGVFRTDLADLDGGAAVVRGLFDLAAKLFLNLLKMIIVPLIFTSIVSGVLSVGEVGGLGRLGFKTALYYVGTSTLAIVTGLILVNVVHPGKDSDLPVQEIPADIGQSAAKTPIEFLVDFVLDIIPLQPIGAMAEGRTLQVIFFALLVGFTIPILPERHRNALAALFEAGFSLMMRIVQFVLWFAPVGVFAMITAKVAQVEFSSFVAVAWYALTVLLALVLHACVTLPLLLWSVGRVSPWRHFRAMGPALMTAFSTASSGGTLPLTLKQVEEKAGVSNRVTSFVLPMGATINMDGTALYECIAAMFIAQVYVAQGVIDPLTFGQQALVVVTALAASIGAAAVPHAGLVMIGVVLTAIGLPLEGIGYILAVDRVLDMCRTTVNVWSDSCGAVIVARTEGETDILTD